MNLNEILRKSYSGKKVLLTGHTGFKGAWLLLWLEQLGAAVKGYALEPEHANDLYSLVAGKTGVDSVIADIRDREKLASVIKEFRPDFIFHLAAQPLVLRSYREPLYTFEVNVNGTANVLEALRGADHSCTVVIITTDKVYENNETGQAYAESDKLGGYDPYSASKAAAEIVVSSYRNSFFNPLYINKHGIAVASARAGNVIGGGDRSENRIIPDIVRGIETGQEIIVRNPASTRPWQFVLEPLAGYLQLGAALQQSPADFAEAWNFGPEENDVLTVKQVVEKALSIYGKGSWKGPEQKQEQHEAGLLNLSIAKAKERLDWHPRLRAGEAIEYTIEWYKEVNKENAYRYSLSQLEKFAAIP